MNAFTVWGILFPASLLHSQFFGVLAAFVAINTIMYATLAVAKMLPKVYVADWVPRRYRRSETRSIHPSATAPGSRGRSGQSSPRKSP